jgi:shikimate kinase/3-dehydroquinate synthase
MGAGKTTVASRAAERIGWPHVDSDEEVAARAGKSIAAIFEEDGEETFRRLEEAVIVELLSRPGPGIFSLGGGSVESERVRHALHESAVTAWLDDDIDVLWERARASDRPLARDESEFRRLYHDRWALYAAAADVNVFDDDDIVCIAGRLVVETGALKLLDSWVFGEGPVALVSDRNVAGIHGMDTQLALGSRLAEVHELPPGEAAKTLTAVDRLWQELRLDRSGTLVALGGGCTTDAVGFAAATYLRGIPWVAVPTSLVAQVDAAIGGKTAIDLPQGKNLVGAFHWPSRTVIDPALLETLPEPQRLEGMAEVVKTGLLAGEPLWELADDELVRRCAAFKAAICLRDPEEQGERAILNLGHTFAHALEAAAGYEGLTHGRAVALGLLAALRLSGRDTGVVEEVLRPQPARVDRERAWQALLRDKKTRGGVPRLILLGADGPEWGVELPEAEVRRELDRLIA